MAFLGFLLPRPFAGRGFDGIEMSSAMLRGRAVLLVIGLAPHCR